MWCKLTYLRCPIKIGHVNSEHEIKINIKTTNQPTYRIFHWLYHKHKWENFLSFGLTLNFYFLEASSNSSFILFIVVLLPHYYWYKKLFFFSQFTRFNLRSRQLCCLAPVMPSAAAREVVEEEGDGYSMYCNREWRWETWQTIEWVDLVFCVYSIWWNKLTCQSFIGCCKWSPKQVILFFLFIKCNKIMIISYRWNHGGVIWFKL